eukprot:6492157-Amphidinium_carterae.7
MFIQTLGLPHGIIQSDSEHSALAVRKAAVEPIVGWSTTDPIEIKRFKWNGLETTPETARHVQDNQVMPRRTVPDEDSDTSSKFAVVISTRSMVERPIHNRSAG